MKCDSPIRIRTDEAEYAVSCGKCPPCKLNRVNSWVFRLQQEDKRAVSAYFITLTYSTEHVPISENGFMTLKKDDFQRFMKRLRKLQATVSQHKLKYYCAGEYGTNNWRPHYHLILFNLADTKFVEQAWQQTSLISGLLSGENATATLIGQVDIGSVTGDSIAYTCKYIDKPKRVPAHSRDDRVPEFSLMSKGLGENYVTDAMLQYHKADLSRNFITKEGGHKIGLPRYYRKKIYDELELTAQRSIIAENISLQEAKDREEFERHHPSEDYDAFKRSGASARYERFYSKSNKIRKL